MNSCADREPIAVCPVNPYATSLSTPPHPSSHTLEIRAAAPYPRYGGIFAFCSHGLSRLAIANRAIFTAQGCCESIGSGRIGRKLAVGNISEKAGSLKMLRTRRPQVSDNSAVADADDNLGRISSQRMRWRGEEKKHNSHFKEVVAQNVAQNVPMSPDRANGCRLPHA
jgi:hypothetical protein